MSHDEAGAAQAPVRNGRLLVTDVEGSTKLFHELGPDGYAQALDEHRRVFARPSGPTALTADEAAAARRRIARLRGSLADD
jgi:class 3 adenylate cyclase